MENKKQDKIAQALLNEKAMMIIKEGMKKFEEKNLGVIFRIAPTVQSQENKTMQNLSQLVLLDEKDNKGFSTIIKGTPKEIIDTTLKYIAFKNSELEEKDKILFENEFEIYNDILKETNSNLKEIFNSKKSEELINNLCINDNFEEISLNYHSRIGGKNTEQLQGWNLKIKDSDKKVEIFGVEKSHALNNLAYIWANDNKEDDLKEKFLEKFGENIKKLEIYEHIKTNDKEGTTDFIAFEMNNTKYVLTLNLNENDKNDFSINLSTRDIDTPLLKIKRTTNKDNKIESSIEVDKANFTEKDWNAISYNKEINSLLPVKMSYNHLIKLPDSFGKEKDDEKDKIDSYIDTYIEDAENFKRKDCELIFKYGDEQVYNNLNNNNEKTFFSLKTDKYIFKEDNQNFILEVQKIEDIENNINRKKRVFLKSEKDLTKDIMELEINEDRKKAKLLNFDNSDNSINKDIFNRFNVELENITNSYLSIEEVKNYEMNKFEKELRTKTNLKLEEEINNNKEDKKIEKDSNDKKLDVEKKENIIEKITNVITENRNSENYNSYLFLEDEEKKELEMEFVNRTFHFYNITKEEVENYEKKKFLNELKVKTENSFKELQDNGKENISKIETNEKIDDIINDISKNYKEMNINNKDEIIIDYKEKMETIFNIFTENVEGYKMIDIVAFNNDFKDKYNELEQRKGEFESKYQEKQKEKETEKEY